MQIKKEQLQRQQVIMSHLGFYRNKCDGIWGPASIDAKKRWESDPSFIPALPNNGLPFGDRDPLPKGMSKARGERMFAYAGLEAEKIDSIMGSENAAPEKVEDTASEPASLEEQTSPEPEAASFTEASPEQEASSDSEAGPEQEAKSEQEPTPSSAHFQNPHFKKKKKHQNR